MKIHEAIYNYAIYISYILYILIIFGITKYAPQYLDMLKNIIKIYVSIILIVKFNPYTFKEKKISEFDSRLVFSSGIFLLLSTSIISILEKYFIDIIKNTPINNIVNDLPKI